MDRVYSKERSKQTGDSKRAIEMEIDIEIERWIDNSGIR